MVSGTWQGLLGVVFKSKAYPWEPEQNVKK